MEDIIRIEHLSKSFGEVKAVQDLSFRVKEGELFAFLGINGAGKSTTINIMCGQLGKDGGSVEIDGADLDHNLDHIKRELGVVFQNSVLDAALSVRDNLQSRAALYGIRGAEFAQRLTELAKLLDFENILNRPVGKLSGGQRRRIDIARALLHRPRILVFDEPTTGLDPQTRKLLWDVVTELRKREKLTVFLTTHYMEEAVDADYVIILDGGKIAGEGTPLELKNTYAGDFVTLYGVEESAVKALGRAYTAVRDGWRIEVPNTGEATKLILENPALFTDYEITKGKMDDVFLAVTGKKLIGGEGLCRDSARSSSATANCFSGTRECFLPPSLRRSFFLCYMLPFSQRSIRSLLLPLCLPVLPWKKPSSTARSADSWFLLCWRYAA